MAVDNDNPGPATTLLPGEAPDSPAPKRREGGQRGNKNARKHGLFAADAKRIDLRRREDKAVLATLRAIEEDIGADELTAARRVILDGVGRKQRDLFKLEDYLAGVSIVNKRRRCLIPAVLEKHRILESIRRDLETLGLERRARQLPDLGDYLAKKSGQA